MFNTIDRLILNVTSAIVASLIALMTATVIIGVFYRYVLNDALPWPEEFARFAMIWISWVGGGIALRRGAHVATDLLVNQLPPGPRRILLFVGNVLILAFLVIVLVNGIALVQRVAFQSTIALGISMQIPYAAAPIGSALMIYHLLVLMIVPQAAPTNDSELQV
jgi:TRAP-type C4-dicarboxylate transport system permease small subunit